VSVRAMICNYCLKTPHVEGLRIIVELIFSMDKLHIHIVIAKKKKT